MAEKIILYHGTNESRAKKILDDGCIKANVDRIYSEEEFLPQMVTTDGFIYLTDLIPLAITYGNKASIIEHSLTPGYLYLFEIALDKKELLADIDEIKQEALWNKELNSLAEEELTWEYSLDLVHSVTVNHDISLRTACTRYAVLPNNNFIDEPLLGITRASIYYRPTHDAPFPDCIKEIPWKNFLD